MRGFRNTLKPLNILPPEAEEQVHRATLKILREHGVIFEDGRALDLFRKAGLKVDDAEQRVFFPPEFVEQQIAKAPAQFTLQARHRDNDVIIGGDHLVFAPVSGPPFVADREGGRRDGTLEEQNNLVRLSEVIDVMHHGCPEVAVKDLPVETRHLDILYHQVRLSSKGMIGDAWSTERARDHIDMMAIVFGGRPEAALGILSSAQMARRYSLPCRAGGVLTNSKVPDAQAGWEKMMQLWPIVLGGCHYVLHGAGWLDGGLTASFEAMVLDAEM